MVAVCGYFAQFCDHRIRAVRASGSSLAIDMNDVKPTDLLWLSFINYVLSQGFNSTGRDTNKSCTYCV